jgi:hypothetical protein
METIKWDYKSHLIVPLEEFDSEVRKFKADLEDLDSDLEGIQNDFNEKSLSQRIGQILQTKRGDIELRVSTAVDVD